MISWLKDRWSSLFDPFGDKARARQPASRSISSSTLPPPAPLPPVTSPRPVFRAPEPAAEPVPPAPEPVSLEEDEMTPREILEDESDHASPRFSEAFIKVLAECGDVDSLNELFDLIGEKSPHSAAVLDKVGTLDLSLKELRSEFGQYGSKSPLVTKLFEMIVAKTVDPEDWVALFDEASGVDDAYLTRATEAAEKLQWSKEQLEKFRDALNDSNSNGCYDDDIQKAHRRIVNLINSLTDLVDYFDDYTDNWEEDDETLKAMFERMFALATAREVEIIRKFASFMEDDRGLSAAAETFLKKPRSREEEEVHG